MRFECDSEAFKFRRAMDEAFGEPVRVTRALSLRELARADRAALQVLRVHRLRERAKVLFPGNEWNQEAWVQACLRLRQIGCRRPRVQIGCAHHLTGDTACKRTTT